MKNVFQENFKISQSDRKILLEQNPKLIWFTGLSGSGKSTLANALEQSLHTKGYKTYILDGDNIRRGINKDLGFSLEDRKTNLLRIAEIGKLMIDAGLITICAFISPVKNVRDKIKEIVDEDNFIEVYVDCPLDICEDRDVKGLYKKARKGEIKDFTGIDSPYEKPVTPDIIVNSHKKSIEESITEILNVILPKLDL